MSADTIKELHIQRDKWIEAAIKQQSRAKRAEASLASSHEEIAHLRKALIACGRNVGAGLSDEVSTDFLMLVPEEVRLVVERLRASKAGAA
ncbi:MULTISPECIES: hypothetical protein [unclassified Mesorhizobium]|uniref:hypothetical protein n=1 Tax=unclassified Mesorhizobium TaxID=325217 RepID=UPI001128ED31|nr:MULTISPECIES: hypothetical protein [unclassified Mesorhizobium]TPJ86913.1 hypothetical protein FJ489_30635 [Mesorhizobium sp. B2-5-12]TPK19136.1 hypothetical protein FJ562_31040 [Mesorhizobium sp. B2-5-6]